ncbi:hypothetical protein HY990_05400 [Candidatus Micrarchaeota archaeon]|nr:hypothetical protein [Candidatus Micrarchaeota archaeon]
MSIIRNVLLILALFTLSFAVVIESGDGGKQFSQETSVAKCREAQVKAVYICLGNVVKVVSSQPGEGSTFYKPDGRTVKCPDVAPTSMGAECLQMMTPNYCPEETKCGVAPAPQVFPGQNNTIENKPIINNQTLNQSESINQSPPVVTPAPTTNNQQSSNSNSETGQNEVNITTPKAKTIDSTTDNLILVVAGLGVVSIVVLFLLFRKTLSE